MYFNPISFTKVCNEQNIIMCRAYKKLINIIVFNKSSAVTSSSSSTLLFILSNRYTFHVTKFRNHDNHVFFLDHIFNIDFFYFVSDNIGLSVISVFFCNFINIIFNYTQNLFRIGKQIIKIINPCLQFLNFILKIFYKQMSKPFQWHFNNSSRLLIINIKSFAKSELSFFRIAT